MIRTASASLLPAPAVEITGLIKIYSNDSGAVRALDGIDAVVPRGVIFGLLGPKRRQQVDSD